MTRLQTSNAKSMTIHTDMLGLEVHMTNTSSAHTIHDQLGTTVQLQLSLHSVVPFMHVLFNFIQVICQSLRVTGELEFVYSAS